MSPESPVQRERPAWTDRRSTIMSCMILVPTCSAWSCICSISHGPWITSAKPGIILDIGGDRELAARLQARHQDRCRLARAA